MCEGCRLVVSQPVRGSTNVGSLARYLEPFRSLWWPNVELYIYIIHWESHRMRLRKTYKKKVQRVIIQTESEPENTTNGGCNKEMLLHSSYDFPTV